jgi:hypothetical protein
MTILEYLGGFGIAISISISMSFLLHSDAPILSRAAIGAFIGFAAFLIGLMAMTVIGGVYLNSFVASMVLSLLARNSWSNL